MFIWFIILGVSKMKTIDNFFKRIGPNVASSSSAIEASNLNISP